MTIAQKLLRNYLAASTAARQATATAAELRKQIIAAAAAGAQAEEGALDFAITQTSSRRLSRAKVEAVLGIAATADLLARVQPTVETRLTVFEGRRSVPGPLSNAAGGNNEAEDDFA